MKKYRLVADCPIASTFSLFAFATACYLTYLFAYINLTGPNSVMNSVIFPAFTYLCISMMIYFLFNAFIYLKPYKERGLVRGLVYGFYAGIIMSAFFFWLFNDIGLFGHSEAIRAGLLIGLFSGLILGGSSEFDRN